MVLCYNSSLEGAMELKFEPKCLSCDALSDGTNMAEYRLIFPNLHVYMIQRTCALTCCGCVQEREEVSEIDLRKVVELKPPEASGTAEHQTSFQIILQDK